MRQVSEDGLVDAAVLAVDLQQRVELPADNLLDFAVVDNAVERVTHFVRDSRVNQCQQFTFGLRRVVENFLTDVNEADHIFTDSHLMHLSVFFHPLLDLDLTFVYLIELKRRHEVFFNSLHARQILYKVL